MIRIETATTAGWRFVDWVDCLINSEDQTIIPDYDIDIRGRHWKDGGIEDQQVFWLHYLAEYRQCYHDIHDHTIPATTIPDCIVKSRGIGAWHNPKYVIACGNLNSGTMMETNWSYWEHLPQYKRLRPFNTTKKELNFFYRLLGGNKVSVPNQTWITSVTKNWVPTPLRHELLFKELDYLGDKTTIVVCLGKDVFDIVNGMVGTSLRPDKIKLLPHPTFYGSNHGWEWQQYRQQFALFLEGKADAPR